MDRQKRLLTVLAAMLVALAAAMPAAAQSALKIGVFDSQRISEETAEGKRIQQELTSLSEAKQEELSNMEQALSDLQQRLGQQQLSLSAERRTALELDIQRRALELNNAKDLASRELQLEFAAAEARFNEKLRQVVGQFALDENFSLLLEYGAVAWSATSIDVTTAIIDLFDKMYPAQSEE
jgi:Skp family chaperone for outer membrane proteins